MQHVLVGALALLAACDAGRLPDHSPPISHPAADVATSDTTVEKVETVATPDAAAPMGDAADPFSAVYFGEGDPMVSRDGAHVLLYVVDDDGARGAPNLTLEVRDRRDHTVARVVMLAPEEELDALDPAVRASRAAAADKLIASHEWIGLAALQESEDREAGHFEHGGIVIDWKGEHVTIRAAGKRVIDRRVPAAWQGEHFFDKAADLTCDNPDYLSGAYGSAELRLAVVDVAYRGNDTCWEPTSQLHVMSW